MGVWDVTTPDGGSIIKDGDDRIREMKIAIQEALRGQGTEGDESIFPGSAPLTAPLFRYRGKKGTTVARPTAGQQGLYFDTDKQTLYRDNGASWDPISYLVPAGTKELFYQGTAPLGWTRDVTVNDRFIRVLSAGKPGRTTGTGTISTSGNAVTGSGTAFLTELYVGCLITCEGQTKEVTVITDDTHAIVYTAFSPNVLNKTFDYSAGGNTPVSTNFGSHTHGPGTLYFPTLQMYTSGAKYLRGFTSGGANDQFLAYGTCGGSGTDLLVLNGADRYLYTKPSGGGGVSDTTTGIRVPAYADVMIATKDAY